MQKPFKRMGGKKLLAHTIIEMLPKCGTFVEVFAGGGSVFFGRPERSDIEVLNDLDITIYRTYKALQNKDVNKTFPRTMTYDKFNELKKKKDGISQLALSCYSFFGAKKSFEGKKGTTLTCEKDFSPYKERLKGVIIEHNTFQECIRKYDSPTTCFYLDPPYEDSEDYSNKVEPKDVYDALQGIKGKFILSYNNSPVIRNIFKKYNIKKIKTTYSGTPNIEQRKVTELIITNF
jgi:DNA adenine methylase